MEAIKTDDVVENVLFQANAEVGKNFQSDVLLLSAPMVFGVDDFVRSEIESMNEGEELNQKLVVILETTGGYVETVERIVSVFRRHYEEVDFVVPNFAYSAGTVLVLSGDNIYMDYYSVLGPIDPQFELEGGDLVSGMGYISKYNELIRAINAVSDDEIGTVRAELSFLLKKFDPAKIFHIEQAIKHSQDLLRDWLPKYKFKDWVETETQKIAVTPQYKAERAEHIATVLGDAEHWHSHGRGISMRDLANDAIGLQVIDFGENEGLNYNIRHYHGLFNDYTQKMGMKSAIHSSHRLRRIH